MNFIKLKITYLAVLFLLINALQSFAQNKSNTNSFSFGYLLSDFGNSKNGEDRKFHKFKQMDKGFVVNYAHYLNRSFDISTTLGYSKVSFGGLLNQKYAMINVALNLKYKFNNGYIFNEDAVFAPYVISGLGFNKMNYFAGGGQFYGPYGIGININVTKNIALGLQTSYNYSTRNYPILKDIYGDNLSPAYEDYFQHSISLVFTPGRKSKGQDTVVDAMVPDSCYDVTKSKWSFGIHYALADYGNIKYSQSGQEYFYRKAQDIARRASITRYLSPSFDLNLDLVAASVRFGDILPKYYSMYASDLTMKYKLNNGYIYKENVRIAPYFMTGLGFSKMNYFAGGGQLYIPFGAGLQVKLTNSFAVQLQTVRHQSTDEFFDKKLKPAYEDYFLHSFGLVYTFCKKKEKVYNDVIIDFKTADTIPMIFDKDSDGVVDKDDKCPDIAGVKENSGCPIEKAKDSVQQSNPTKDGVVNSVNPFTNSISKISNNTNNTNNTKNTNNTTPVQAAQEKMKEVPLAEVPKALLELQLILYFKVNSAEINAKDFIKLDKAASILNNYREYGVKLVGYADSDGDKQKNLELSTKRAKGVELYLLLQGVAQDQIVISEGYGSVEGGDKAKNRNVQLVIVKK